MRKIYLLAIVMFATLQATTLMAQEEIVKIEGSHSFIPKQLTKERKPFCIIFNGEIREYEKDIEFSIYDTDFKKVKQFTITPEEYTNKKRIEEREGVTGEWIIREEDEGVYYNFIHLYDFNDVGNDEGHHNIYLTQTLFNDDEKFEYLMPVWDEAMELYYECDRDDDGEVDYREYRTNYDISRCIGYNIYSDGEKTGYLNIPGGISNIFIFGGKTYITSFSYNENDEYFECIYRFDKATNTIEQVSEPVRAKMSVKENVVNIEFKEPATENCELIVTSTDGRTCRKERIAAGSESVKYDTRALSSGIYNFIVMQNGKAIESGKIIVR